MSTYYHLHNRENFPIHDNIAHERNKGESLRSRCIGSTVAFLHTIHLAIISLCQLYTCRACTLSHVSHENLHIGYLSGRVSLPLYLTHSLQYVDLGVLPRKILWDVERVLLYDQASTSKIIDPPLYHIKGKLVMKACWTDMPCNCWGEH